MSRAIGSRASPNIQDQELPDEVLGYPLEKGGSCEAGGGLGYLNFPKPILSPRRLGQLLSQGAPYHRYSLKDYSLYGLLYLTLSSTVYA